MSAYDSLSQRFKQPFGALRTGESVRFTLRLGDDIPQDLPRLVIKPDGGEYRYIEMTPVGREDNESVYEVSFSASEAGLYFYHFDTFSQYTKIAPEGADWQLTVYERDFDTPGAQGSVMYQIFPDRFYGVAAHSASDFPDRVLRCDKNGTPEFRPDETGEVKNNDYFCGDLRGIEEKLDYLCSLSVTHIYLNPIFEAHSNHRYNTADYLNIDPLLGTEEDFARLCAEAKKRGIGIILDGVFSHTGDDSVYFNRTGRYGSSGAYRDRESPYFKWYDFYEYPDKYRAWWGFKTLPEVNENEPSYRRFICGEGGVIDKWMSLGAAGFRLDVADELPDSFIAEIRSAVKRHGGLLIGEVWEDASNKISYGTRRKYLFGNGLDSVMNYVWRNAVIDFIRFGGAEKLRCSIETLCENYPPCVLKTLMNFLSTHDTERAITALAGEEAAGRAREWQSTAHLSEEQYICGKKRLCMAYALLYTLPGIPCIYYGDEIAMQGYRDPFNRCYYDWSSTEAEIKNCLKQLAAVRRNPALWGEQTQVIYAEGDRIAYIRSSGEKSVLFALSRRGADLFEVTGESGNIMIKIPESGYVIYDC